MDSKKTLTPMETHWSSDPDGNFTTNLDPAFSSEVFKGLNLQTTRILSSDGPSFSWSPPGFDILSSFLSTPFVSTLIICSFQTQHLQPQMDLKIFYSALQSNLAHSLKILSIQSS